MAHRLVVVVTGAGRGIGKGMIELLARQQLERPLTIYATSRSGADVDVKTTTPNEIICRKLDITNLSSIQSFFDSVLKEHTAIDVLINNAAVSNDYRETPEFAAETIWTNYGGTRDMCEAFLSQPNPNPGSRIVNVTSSYNVLADYGPGLQDAFRQVVAVTTLNALADAYLDSVKNGESVQKQAGWGSGARSYKVSKALINALTIVLAQQHPDILVNSCCPGWVNTEMGKQGKGTPPKSIEEGARVPVRLAIGDLGPNGDKDAGFGCKSEPISGRFFANSNIMEPGWGKSHLWLEL